MRKYFVSFCMFFCLVACDNSSNVNVRFINSSPDAPDLDLVVDDDRLFRDVSYASSTEYLETDSGDQEIEINPASSNSQLVSFNFDLSKDTDYTIIATDYLSQITPLVLVDDNSDADEDMVRLRLVHASPTAGAVDIYASDSSVTLTTLEPIVRNLGFGQSSDYIELPAGNYRIRATRTGKKVPIFDKGSSALDETETYTAILQDSKDGGFPLGIDVINDTRAAEDVDQN